PLAGCGAQHLGDRSTCRREDTQEPCERWLGPPSGAQHHLSQSRMRASARRLPKALAPCLGTSVHWDFFACLAREPRQIGFSEDQFLKTWQFGWAKSCSFGR
ncbi:unnamed protein product, partial [Effrenium voratum]